MKQKTSVIGFIVMLIMLFNNYIQQSDFPVLKGPNLSQKPLRMNPVLFALFIFSKSKGR